MKPTNAQIRQFITTTFNDSELETFCFDYFPEVKYTRGMEFSHKVENLIGYCQRRGRGDDLLASLQIERPQPFAEHFKAKTARPQLVETQPRNSRQIFISHAHEDAELAQRLASDLEAEGWPVWIAPDSIQPGEKWASAISRGLDESGIFVLLLTQRAVKSHWVIHESDVALELEHDGEMLFIPLFVQPCRIPALWRAYQQISFGRDYWIGLATLLATLGKERSSWRKKLDDSTTSESGEGFDIDFVLPDFTDSLVALSDEPEEGPRWLIELDDSATSGSKVEFDMEPIAALSPSSFVHEMTGLVFVCVPAGEFLYGEYEERKTLPEFWMGKTPVTNAVYKLFLDANPKQNVPFRDIDWAKPYNWDMQKRIYPVGKADHPVVLVSWDDSVGFCVLAGFRLATEEEWEKAARGTDGRKYPWGNEQPTRQLCNFDKNEGGTTPVGKYSLEGDSPYGCVDISGNVWEWMDTEVYFGRALGGGSWRDSSRNAHVAVRSYDYPDLLSSTYGFRPIILVGSGS